MLQRTTPKESSASRVLNRVAAHPLAQHYGTLLHNVCGRDASAPSRTTIGVTSVHLGAGATTVTMNLGWRSAGEGASTLVVDLDLKRQDLTRRLRGKAKTCGFLEYLHSEVDLNDCLQETEDDHLQLLSSGKGSGLVAPEVVQHVILELSERFDLVLFDLPPVAEGGLLQTLGQYFAGTLLVLEADQESRRELLEAKRKLAEMGVKVTGAVWNKQKVV